MEQFTVIHVSSILNLVILIKIGCIKICAVCLSSRQKKNRIINQKYSGHFI